MNSEQTDEDIFSKMISFGLLKFKFTQIGLMDRNGPIMFCLIFLPLYALKPVLCHSSSSFYA
jgi:hypothetical protein